MKKRAWLILFLCLPAVFAGCGQTAVDEQEMVQIMAQKNGISGEAVMRSAGTVDLGDVVLMLALTGDQNQGRKYYAAEFRREVNQYQFAHSYKLMERGTDMTSLMWADGYVFLSNSESSKSLRIRFPNGEKEDELIPIETTPFVYYLDLSEVQTDKVEFSFEYHFMNEKGEVISQ